MASVAVVKRFVPTLRQYTLELEQRDLLDGISFHTIINNSNVVLLLFIDSSEATVSYYSS